MENQLPPRPDEAGVEKGSKNSVIVAGIALVIIILVGTIIFLATNDDSVAVSNTQTVACIDDAQVALVMDNATSALNDSLVDAKNYNLSGMSQGISNSAAYVRQAASLTSADPTISGNLTDAANSLDSASEAILDNSPELALSYLDDATTSMQLATQAKESTTVPSC